MSILRVSFLLFVFSFTFSVKAQQTANDLFVDFVIESLEVSGQVEEFEQIMGPDWIDEIVLHTTLWNNTDAQHFLNVLKESGVKSEHILKLLQTGSYLQALHAGHLHFQFIEEGERLFSAADVFFDFVTEQLESSRRIEEFEQVMGSDWIDEIALYAASWNSTNALHFLNILKEASIEPKYILKILQAGSYLQALQADHLHFEFQVTGEVVDHISSQSTEVEFPEQLRFPEFAFLNTVPTNEISGHDVLIQFVNAARQYLGATDFDRIMGSSWDQSVWERRLIRYMREGGWTRLDARNFVLFLVERIGLENTLKRIRHNSSYLRRIVYLDFRDKVSFYNGFLGEEIVNES